MKVSYAITVCNEFVEIQRLVNFLVKNKRPKDEIVILYDEGNGDPKVEEYLRAKSVNGEFSWHKSQFNRHFADWKNKLASFCSGDYIYQIDADEMISEYALTNLPMVLQYNSVDVIQIPRINTVEGLTQQHIEKWGWRVNNEGWVNFPDYQWRVYKNDGSIKWKNKVHEVLEGYKTISQLPSDKPWCLEHPKTIKRQEKQNEYYDTL
tara:strand:+ start:1137 stop:1757 length:621 start_codon:yes stop_codon:yes gene_type:complete